MKIQTEGEEGKGVEASKVPFESYCMISRVIIDRSIRASASFLLSNANKHAHTLKRRVHRIRFCIFTLFRVRYVFLLLFPR
jgi:hypothetical protein